METLSGQRLFTTRLAIGFAQGLVLYLLYSANDDKVWPATQGLVFAPLLFVWVFVPVILTLALGEIPWRKALLWAGVATAVAALLAFFDNWSTWPPGSGDYSTYGSIFGFERSNSPTWQLYIFGGAGLFIAHALVIGGVLDHRFRASYATHFDTAWKLAVQLALAGLFVIAFWLLLWLGAGLFNLIKLDFFQKLIVHQWFSRPATTLAIAGALHLTDVRPALVRGARTLLLTLLAWLLPLITLIVAGFVISLPFTGLKPLWSFGHASALLLTATAALTVLVNAAHQDGAAERVPPKPLRLSGAAAAIAMVPLALIAAYALFLRVEQYGWSADRVTLAATILIALSYAGGYAFAASRRGPWLAFLEAWNFNVALLILATLVALFTPIANPIRIAVGDQLARLHSGKIPVAKFDFSYLRWEGGRYGQSALLALAADPDAQIKKMAQNVLEQKRRYAEMNDARPLAERLTVYPTGQKLPPSFTQMDWSRGKMPWVRPNCPMSGWCDAILADLDGDGRSEVLVTGDPGIVLQVFQEASPGDWRQVGAISPPPNCPAILEALRQGHFSTSPPVRPWKDLQLNGVRLHMREFDAGQEGPKCPS